MQIFFVQKTSSESLIIFEIIKQKEWYGHTSEYSYLTIIHGLLKRIATRNVFIRFNCVKITFAVFL
jgi:hypothetical protein